MKTGVINHTLKLFLAGLILISVLLFPEITIKSSLPSFQLIDFLFPFLCLVIFIERKSISWNKFYGLALIFFTFILFSILYNGRQGELRDYFELYKLMKFGVVVLFFTLIQLERFFSVVIKPVFVLLVAANILHYFNVFDFNVLIANYYHGGVHIETFGLDSLGQPTYKRMLGFSGNPNINSIVFGFFTVLFYPKKPDKIVSYTWFFVALLMLFLCQSRTNLIAITVVLLFTLFYQRDQIKFHFKVIMSSALVYLVSFLVASNSYLNTLFVEKVTNHNSLMGRIEVWKCLWEMIKEKPLFGHAPFKEYFYERTIYSENEYILQTWRYGFLGLLSFLSMLLYPILTALKNKTETYRIELIQFSLLILINGLTNNPFSDRITMVLFAIIIGFYFNKQSEAYE